MAEKARPIIISPSSSFEAAKEVFKAGGVIAYPTETFYGLCVDPFNMSAVQRLFALKGRAETKAVSLIIKDRKMLRKVALDIPPLAEKLMARFWPGPLTIIFHAHPEISPRLIGNTGKVGVRVSSSPVSLKLVEALNSPITATSANPSGKKPPHEAKEIIDYFNGSIDILIDGGRLHGRLGSTIVDVTGGAIEVIREGEVPSLEIMSALR